MDRWEKDPFFSAAEEVQESADRMESLFRRWINPKKDAEGDHLNVHQVRRDLQTALGTTKWQLEEFEKATRTSYNTTSSDDEKTRHREFIVAIESNISRIETSLNETTSHDKPPLSWVRLDDDERDELAVFLSGAPLQVEKTSTRFHVISDETGGALPDESTRHSVQLNPLEGREEKQFPGHRRTASANADIGSSSVKIAVSAVGNADNAAVPPSNSNASFSGSVNSLESSSSFSWSKKNGYRKLKSGIPKSQQPQKSKGNGGCYERSKSCLNGCDDCDKHVYGWYGGIKRLIQRSQYQVQYCRPVQIIIWSLLLLCLIILLAVTIVLGVS